MERDYYYNQIERGDPIPEEKKFKIGRRVVYGVGPNGEKLTGVIKTEILGKEVGFSEDTVGIEPDDESLKNFGRKIVKVHELIELNPDGAISENKKDTTTEDDGELDLPKAA